MYKGPTSAMDEIITTELVCQNIPFHDKPYSTDDMILFDMINISRKR